MTTFSPAPKPESKAKSRKPLVRGSPPKRSTTPIPRSPITPKKRSKTEKERIYGSPDKIAFVKRLPCAACGIVGYSEVAHSKSVGMGRKENHRHTLPLCGPHMPTRIGNQERIAFEGPTEGCHAKLHRIGRQSFESFTNCHLETAAAKCELDWQRHNQPTGE
jgi:hypothetical protein